MAFEAKAALSLMQDLQGMVERLQTMPEMQPIAREILRPILNGAFRNSEQTGKSNIGRRLSEETRAKMRAAAQKRWGAHRGRKKAG